MRVMRSLDDFWCDKSAVGPSSEDLCSLRTFPPIPVEGSMLKREARKYDFVAAYDSRVALMPAVTFFRLLDTVIRFRPLH